MNRQELIEIALKEPRIATLNGIQIELTDEEHQQAAEAWADMRLEQIELEQIETEPSQ